MGRDGTAASEALVAEDLTEFGRLYSIVVDARSVFTATHSWDVAAVTEATGRRAGFSADTIVALELAGQLHDVGKRAIGAAILEWPGSLTPDAFAAMRAHAYFSEVPLRRVPGFDDLAKWTGNHLDEIDGIRREAQLEEQGFVAEILAYE